MNRKEREALREWNYMATGEIRRKHPLFLCRLLSTDASFRIVWRNKMYYECKSHCREGMYDRRKCESCRKA